jgi:hypothetical protein
MTPAIDEPRIQQVVGSLNHKMLINGEWVDAASGRTRRGAGCRMASAAGSFTSWVI